MNDRYAYDNYQAVFGVGSVQVLGGYVGQVRFGDDVVWQSEVEAERQDAYELASDYLKETIKELFQ